MCLAGFMVCGYRFKWYTVIVRNGLWYAVIGKVENFFITIIIIYSKKIIQYIITYLN